MPDKGQWDKKGEKLPPPPLAPIMIGASGGGASGRAMAFCLSNPA